MNSTLKPSDKPINNFKHLSEDLDVPDDIEKKLLLNFGIFEVTGKLLDICLIRPFKAILTLFGHK